MKAGHTPGPWEVRPKGAPVATKENFLQTLHVQQVDGLTVIVSLTRTSHEHATPEDMANARLIAAAPELLEALKAALERLHCANLIRTCKQGQLMTSDVEAAIAKATP